jgi:hypothetical protein
LIPFGPQEGHVVREIGVLFWTESGQVMKNSVSRKNGHWILCTPAAREERARPRLVARHRAFSEGRKSGHLTQNQDGRVRYGEDR